MILEKNQETYPLFVYFFKEPPGRDGDILYKQHPTFYNLFNITYTYKRDSVIPFLYGKVVPKDTSPEELNDVLQDTSNVEWKPVPKEIPKSISNSDLSHKTKGILWMVSHCETDSRREEYVKKLEGHLSTLKIDILGKCGKDKLPDSNVDGRKLGKYTKQRMGRTT